MFDPENIVKLAIEGGCNAVASTFGVLGITARKYAHKIPYIVKINHNELLSYPNTYDQTMFASVRQAYELRARGHRRHGVLGLPGVPPRAPRGLGVRSPRPTSSARTVLWCYVRNGAFKTALGDQSLSADLTGQANHLGVTIQADIIKQKLPELNGGYNDPALKGFGKTHKKVYSELTTDNPIDLTRYQLANCYMGRIGLINRAAPPATTTCRTPSRPPSINKRAGGMGLIAGRKAFQRPIKEGVELLNAIQDVYLCNEVTIA